MSSPRRRASGGEASGLRHWIILWNVLLVALLSHAGWIYYAHTQSVPRFEQLTPGASATMEDGSSVRVVKMFQTTRLESTVYAEVAKPVEAVTGTTFVVVHYEVIRRSDEEKCFFRLATGPGVEYEQFAGTPTGRPLHPFCSNAPLGTPQLGEAVFMVPNSQLGRVYGLALSRWTPLTHRTIVLRPA